MNQQVFDTLIAEVDAECRQHKIPMLGPEKANRLCELVWNARPDCVVEVGTAIGYSGLWIAKTLHDLGHGHLFTLEKDPERAAQAKRNFERASLDNDITVIVGDARERIDEVGGPIDLLFLDGGFANYYPCLMRCQSRLRDGALLVADNAGIGAAEMDDYLTYVRTHFQSSTEWFETDLEWNPRDAMEISTFVIGH